MSAVSPEVLSQGRKKDRNGMIPSSIRQVWGLGNVASLMTSGPPCREVQLYLLMGAVSGRSILHTEPQCEAALLWILASVFSQVEPKEECS